MIDTLGRREQPPKNCTMFSCLRVASTSTSARNDRNWSELILSDSWRTLMAAGLPLNVP